jgi:hypothetical protein
VLALDQQRAPAGARELGREGNAGLTGTDDDGVVFLG